MPQTLQWCDTCEDFQSKFNGKVLCLCLLLDILSATLVIFINTSMNSLDVLMLSTDLVDQSSPTNILLSLKCLIYYQHYFWCKNSPYMLLKQLKCLCKVSTTLAYTKMSHTLMYCSSVSFTVTVFHHTVYIYSVTSQNVP